MLEHLENSRIQEKKLSDLKTLEKKNEFTYIGYLWT
jgi:hypothetical protein